MTVPPEPGYFNRPDWTEEDQRLRASMENELPPRQSLIDREDFLQADPVMVEGDASRTRIVVYAIAALLIVCVVLYGMGNIRSNTTASNPPAATTAATKMMRNATPGPNMQPGTTTGAAPGSPTQPTNPAAAGPGSTSR